MIKPCAFEGCANDTHHAPGNKYDLCMGHLIQKRKGYELKPLRQWGAGERWMKERLLETHDECDWWPYANGTQGRPVINYKGKTHPAARVLCELAYGPPPTPSHQAAHSCGKGQHGCMNPRHLRWATPKENSADKFAHGTHVCGEASPLAKLTEAEVIAIRELRLTLPQAEVASMFGVSSGAIYGITSGNSWRHI